MLQIVVGDEWFDENTNRFITNPECVLHLEHSLSAIRKWESKWKKSFFQTIEKSPEELLDYIKCMTLDNVPDGCYTKLHESQLKQIVDYMADTMTATTFGANRKTAGRHRIVTAELVYYWMIELGIPVEFENWHINQLMTLIQVCDEEQKPAKKMSMNDAYKRHNSLNKRRRRK